MTTILWNEFLKKYRPSSNDEYSKQFPEDDGVAAFIIEKQDVTADRGHVRSVFDIDGATCVKPGIYYIDVVGYIETAMPCHNYALTVVLETN